MSRYASQTSVPADRSRAEIERILERYGASAFAYGWEDGRASIQFHADARRVRFILPLPERDAFRLDGRGYARAQGAQEKAHAQAIRQRWRALALAVKAKLEAVESGIATFEEEFLPYIVLPNGQTVGQFILPQVATAYEEGTMPKLLPEKT